MCSVPEPFYLYCATKGIDKTRLCEGSDVSSHATVDISLILVVCNL